MKSACLIYILIFLNLVSNCNFVENDEASHSKISNKLNALQLRKKIQVRDSLESIIKSVESDSLQLDLSFDISYKYLQKNDSLEFRYWNKVTRVLSEKMNNINKLAESHWDLASFFYKNNVPDSAYFNYVRAHRLYKDANNDFFASRMLLNMGILQENFKDFVESETTTFEALKTFEDLRKLNQMYIGYSNLGVVYNGLEDPENSIKFHTKALDVATEMNDSILISKTLNNIGAMYSDREEYHLAVKYFNSALRVDNLMKKDPALFATLKDNKAFAIFKIQPQNLEVRKDFEYALEIREKINKSSGIIMSWLHLGELSLFEGDTTKADSYFTKARELSYETHNFDYLLESFKYLDKANPRNKVYLNTYLNLNDSLVEEERKIRNKFARIRYETDSYIAKTKTLSEQRYYLLIFILLGGVSAVLAYYYLSQRNRNKVLMIEQEQQKANEKIYDLLLTQHTQMEVGKEKERQRIAGELHDGVLGRLFGTRMSLGFLETTDQESIDPYLNELQNIEKEIREISHDLMDKRESMVGNFVVIINDLIDDKKQRLGFQIDLDIEEGLNLDNLSPNVQVNLYRILQESIQNVIKHAGTKRMDIIFRIYGDMIEMIVKDYGNGMDVKKTTEGIGIKSMRNRIALIKGKLKVSSNSDGTEIICKIPMNA